MSKVFHYHCAEVGYCDYEELDDAKYGNYVWPETETGQTISLACMYGSDFDYGKANRTCQGTGDWSPVDASNCITFTTYQFRQLGMVWELCAIAVL